MLDDEAIREDGFQFWTEVKASLREFGVPVALDAGQGSPDELIVGQADSPFDPFSRRPIPCQAMDRKSIQQFVGKDDAIDAVLRQGSEGFCPANLPGKLLQPGSLPSLPSLGRVD